MGNKQDFVIDKITNSIEEISTGKSFETEVVPISSAEIKTVHKKEGWSFNWKNEFKKTGRQLYKLILQGDRQIQGLISIEPKAHEFYVELHLIEIAPYNFSIRKKFYGVAGNMVAFACKMSFDLGFDGFVAFTAKTKLVDHYTKSLGAHVIYSHNRMAIFTPSAKNLVNSYYENYFSAK
jgi:hypothetical protein